MTGPGIPSEAPDADRAEQEALLDPPAVTSAGDATGPGADVPEADALEQRQPLLDRDTPEEIPEIDVEVPEEDALEQAMPVPFDEDDAPR